MAKELYLYSYIYDSAAQSLISLMEENKSEDIVLRLNTPGGSVFSGWGIIAKMREHEGNVKIKVDGSAASMGAVMLLYANEVEALDVSKIMLHRASMYSPTPEDQIFLDKVNKDLKTKLLSKIDTEQFKNITGVDFEDLFTAEKRIDVWLTAQEAKKIGLVNKITKLNPEEIEAMNNKMFSIAAQQDTPNPKPNNMTLEELKTKHPEVYAQALKLGGEQEHDRVCSWLAFFAIDAETVVKAVKEKKVMTQTEMVELNMKAFSPEALEKLKKDKPGAVETPETPAGTKEKETPGSEEKDKQVLAFQDKLYEQLKIKK